MNGKIVAARAYFIKTIFIQQQSSVIVQWQRMSTISIDTNSVLSASINENEIEYQPRNVRHQTEKQKRKSNLNRIRHSIKSESRAKISIFSKFHVKVLL